MKISEVIRNNRKKANLTQEQVANYLNISAPAVNKWESSISYPDITLLAPLARILKIDVNTLLAFNEELTDAEVKSLTKGVGETASKEGFPKAFEKASNLIKQYPSCDELVYSISTVLRIYLLNPEIGEKDKYEKKIITWLELVAASSKEKTASMAKLDLSAIYREKKEYEKAQELLDKIPELGLDTYKKIQQALLLESTGKIEETYGVYEEILFSHAHEALGALCFIEELLLKENKLSEAEEYIERAKKLVDVFDLGAYHKYALDLSLAKEKQDKEKALEMITNMVNEAETMDNGLQSKLYRHKKWIVTNKWNKDKYVTLAKGAFRRDKTIDFVKDDPRIKFLLE
jgi:transcriptional regulator with XRE-family HTH domain